MIPGKQNAAAGQDTEILPLTVLMHSFAAGGAERVSIAVANAIAQKGIPVEMVVLKKNGPFQQLVAPSVQIRDFHTGNSILALLRLANHLIQSPPTTILCAHYHIAVASMLLRPFLARKTKIILRVSSIFSRDVPAVTSNQWIHRCLLLACSKLLPWLLLRFDHLIAVSHGCAEDLQLHFRIPAQKITVIYNPLDLQQIEKLANQPIEHPWFHDTIPILVTACRLNHPKDLITLLHAVKNISRHRPIRLIILGEGPDRPRLEAEIATLQLENHVSMPGFVVNPYVFMKKASAFVLSSFWEGMPNVLLEAMACGCPIISTDCPSGPDEILNHGKFGMLVPVQDVNAMTQAIILTLDGQPTPPSAEWLSRFSLPCIVAQYMQCIQNSSWTQTP